MVICLNRAISWQERLLAAVADCRRRWVQYLQVTAKQNGKETKRKLQREAECVSEQKACLREETNHKAAQLLEIYGDSILRMAYSYLHNMSDAEDILQETLIRYLQTMPVLESTAHEKAWLLKVAANLSKNRIDYNRIRQTDELEETLVAEERQDLQFVWEAVRKLPDQYREVIHLFHYEGYATAQIAQILDRKESSVRSDLRRGRQRLKKILKEEYDFA